MNRQDSLDSGWLQEAGQELEQLDHDTNQPRPPRPAQGPDRNKRKPDERPAAPPADAAQDDDVINPGQDDAPPPKPPETPAQPERPMKAPELRKAYEETKSKLAERDQTVTRLEARVRELEQAGPKDTEQTTQRMKAIEDRNKKLEDFIRLKHYEQSEEYAQKYRKPYEEAWERCLNDISQLEVEVSDGKGGYEVRKATDADITYLAQLPLGELIKQSNAMFGDAADVIREHVKRINDTYRNQTEALQQAQQRSVELGKNAQVQDQQQAQVRQKLWLDNNNELSTKFPAYFAPIQGDTNGNKLLDAGFAFADLLFSNSLPPEKIALLPPKYRQELETKGRLSPESKVRVDAIIRNKAANHDRLVRQLKSVRAELAQAKKALGEYEESEPPADGSAPNRNSAASHGHWSEEYNAELDELSRKGPQ